jgi:2OG-Fe(II) oxygenase superfamily
VDPLRFVRTYAGAVDDALAAELTALSGGVKMDEDWRRCSITPVVGDVSERFRRVVRDCFADYRAVAARRTLNACTQLERPSVVRYEPSTDRIEHFVEHADAGGILTATRQISVIAYLNDVVRGGETVFPGFDYSQRCEKGTVLLFPSNFIYQHLARPPESGPKIVVATWLHFGNNGVLKTITTPLGRP